MDALKKRSWWLIPLALTGIVFFNSLKGSFVWDDYGLIMDNPRIKTWAGTFQMFSPQYWRTEHPGTKGQYRPLRNITFTLDYSFWNVDPTGYHLTNVGLHTANTVMVAVVSRYIFSSSPAGLIAGVLFAVHPVHLESVNYVKNRSDLLCTLFFLLGFWCWLRGRQALSVLYCLLSMVSKELGVVFPFVLLAYVFLCLPREEWEQKARTVIPHGALFLAFIIWKFGILVPPPLPAGASPEMDFTIAGVGPVRLIVSTVRAYLLLLFFPAQLVLDRYLPVLHSLLSLKAVAFYFIAALGAYLVLRLKEAKKYSFALLWILLALGPVSNIIPIKGRAFAEQRLYLASAGWALFFGGILAQGLRTGKDRAASFRSVLPGSPQAWLMFCIAAWVLAWSSIIIRRNMLWQDHELLWQQTVKDNPVNSRAWLNLASVYISNGKYAKAEEIYRMLLKYPQGTVTDSIFGHLGIIFQSRGRTQEALECFERAAELNPIESQYWNNIGSINVLLDRNAEAKQALEKAIELERGPSSAGAYANLGVIALKGKDYVSAEKYFRKAVTLNPDLLEARLNLAGVYRSFGMNYEAGVQEREVKLRIKSGVRLQSYNPVVKVQ